MVNEKQLSKKRNKACLLKRSLAFTLSCAIAVPLLVPENTQKRVEKTVHAAAENVNYGDVNSDGKISILDMISLKSYITEKNTKGFSVKAADLDGNGTISTKDAVELSMFLLNQTRSFSYEMNIDTDGDGLCDYVEKEILKTDYLKKDTDGDGLDDYSEVYLCDTDPLNTDTGKTGVKDSMKDADGDKLTNAEEIKLGTSPLSIDTDDDGLNDYDEVKMYKTSPISSDNGKRICVKQKIEKNDVILKKINDNNFYNLSFDLNSSGNARKNLYVHKSVYSNYILNGESGGSIYGDIIDISYCDIEKIDNISINFELKNANPDDYMIFKFYDNINMLLPVETLYSKDEKKIYTEDSDLGTYALVNVKKWYSDFNGRISTSKMNIPIERALATGTPQKHFLFMIDLCYASNSMKIDEELRQLSESIYSRYGSDAVIDICCFSYTQNLAMKKELMVTPYNKLVSMDEVDLILDTYKMYFGVNSNIMMVSSLMETPLDSALSTYNADGYAYNFVFTFAPNRYCENDYYSDTLFEKLNAIPNFHASYIVPSESSTRIIEYVSQYTDKYSGKIFYSSVNLDDEIYSFIKEKCESQSDQAEYFWNNCFNHDITKEWVDNSTDDMDKDGVLDRLEINLSCIKSYDSNGKAIFKSFEEVSNAQDKHAQNGMNEMKSKLKKYGLDDDALYASKMILYNSYPNIDDSDADGNKDKYDPSCAMEMDSCFENTDSFNVDIFDLISDDYIDIMENPENGLNVKYNSEKPVASELLKYELLNLAIQNGSCMVSCVPGSANLFKFFTSFNFDYNITMDTMPVAADCLLAYSLNKYTIKQVPLFDASIGGVRSQRFNYYKHMNMMMSCAENVLIPDSQILIKTEKNTSEFGINYEVDSLQSSYSNFKSAEFDWYIAIGGGQNAIVSDIKCFEEDNEVKYTAKVKYYLFDVYDWQDTAEDMFYNLHLYGLCKSFYEHCYFENTITWSKGMRYPKYDNIWSVDISETEFKGISDSNLKNALKKSKEVYMFS